MNPWEELSALGCRIARAPQEFVSSVPETSLLHQPFLPYPDVRQDVFLVSSYLSSAESVNVMDVVGTAHPDYIGLSSLEMLSAGKWMASVNLPLLASNPGYYLETTKKEPVMEFTRVDGKLYIGGDGNQRTAICRCLFATLGLTTLHGVEYTEYQTNREGPKWVLEARESIARKRLPLTVRVETVAIRRDDSPGWKRDHYETRIWAVHLTGLAMPLPISGSRSMDTGTCPAISTSSGGWGVLHQLESKPPPRYLG